MASIVAALGGAWLVVGPDHAFKSEDSEMDAASGGEGRVLPLAQNGFLFDLTSGPADMQSFVGDCLSQ
jgi:hypothetical protein